MQLLENIVNYFLNEPANQNNPPNRGFLSQARKWLLVRHIGLKLKASHIQGPFDIMLKILQELERSHIVIPLRMRIVFKNLLSINSMLGYVGPETFDGYIRRAGSLFSEIPVLDIATSKNESGSKNNR